MKTAEQFWIDFELCEHKSEELALIEARDAEWRSEVLKVQDDLLQAANREVALEKGLAKANWQRDKLSGALEKTCDEFDRLKGELAEAREEKQHWQDAIGIHIAAANDWRIRLKRVMEHFDVKWEPGQDIEDVLTKLCAAPSPAESTGVRVCDICGKELDKWQSTTFHGECAPAAPPDDIGERLEKLERIEIAQSAEFERRLKALGERIEDTRDHLAALKGGVEALELRVRALDGKYEMPKAAAPTSRFTTTVTPLAEAPQGETDQAVCIAHGLKECEPCVKSGMWTFPYTPPAARPETVGGSFNQLRREIWTDAVDLRERHNELEKFVRKLAQDSATQGAMVDVQNKLSTLEQWAQPFVDVWKRRGHDEQSAAPQEQAGHAFKCIALGNIYHRRDCNDNCVCENCGDRLFVCTGAKP